MSYGTDRTVVPVVIANGTSLSADVNVNGRTIVGIQMPAGWDTASITFAALTRSASGTDTYGKVQDQGGTEVVVTAPAADTYVAIAPTQAVVGLGRIKVRSGVAATPVNQPAERTLYLVLV
jgi:hypothetical protein